MQFTVTVSFKPLKLLKDSVVVLLMGFGLQAIFTGQFYWVWSQSETGGTVDF